MKIYLLTLFTMFYLHSYSQNITQVEYFVDNDPGYSLGINIPITTTNQITKSVAVTIPISFTDGFHYLSIRAKDNANKWGITSVKSFYKETFSTMTAPNITQLEYFIDGDLGFGNGTNVTLAAGNSMTKNMVATIPTNLIDGFHYLSVRAKDSNNKWGIVAVRPFYKETFSTALATSIIQAEYFIDDDPGLGSATNLSFQTTSSLTKNFTLSLPSQLVDGFHYLVVRGKDVNNKWGMASVKPFYKETFSTTTAPILSQVEYFIDDDPGLGNGTNLPFSSGNSLTKSFSIALPSELKDGFHNISIRSKDVNNKWGIIAVRPFYKETFSLTTAPNITRLEYFIDNDPGFGNGQNVPLTATNSLTKEYNINLGSLSNGSHRLSVRALDSFGHWGIISIKDFNVQGNIVSVGSIPTNWCLTTSLNISYTATGVYGRGNVFTVELSDSTGSFDTPTVIGTLASISNSGTIIASIPNTVTNGTGYYIRITSTNPATSNNPQKTIAITEFCTCLLNMSLATGSWSNASIWSCGHIPLATEPIQISTGHTVTLDVNGAAKSLSILGTFQTQQNKVITIQGN
jgi:hypothetical protein